MKKETLKLILEVIKILVSALLGYLGGVNDLVSIM